MELDQVVRDRINIARKQHEFLSFLILEHEVIVGIIQNETQKIVMIYNMAKIKDQETQSKFLAYGDEWWWQSNQRIPINSFIGTRFDYFRPILVGYPKKSIIDRVGPTFNISEQYLKRIKKKKIELIKFS